MVLAAFWVVGAALGEGWPNHWVFPSSELHDQDSVLVPVASWLSCRSLYRRLRQLPRWISTLDGAQHATPPCDDGTGAHSTSQTAQAPIPRADEVSLKFQRTHDARAVRLRRISRTVLPR